MLRKLAQRVIDTERGFRTLLEKSKLLLGQECDRQLLPVLVYVTNKVRSN